MSRMEAPKQSRDPDALPGQPCTKIGSSVDLVVTAQQELVPADIVDVGRRWLAPFLSVSKIMKSPGGFVASGPVTDQDRIERNVANTQVRLRGVVYKITLLSIEQSAEWRACISDSVTDEDMESWSSEFDTTDNELPPWERPPRRRMTPEKRRRKNELRKAARARKRSLSGSSTEMGAAGPSKPAPRAHPVVRAQPTNPGAAHAPPPETAVSTLYDNATQAATVSSVPVQSVPVSSVPVSTIAVQPAAELSVSVPSVAVDYGASAEVPASTTTNAARSKKAKKSRFTALDLSKIDVPVAVSPRATYLFRPVDPGLTLHQAHPRKLDELLSALGKVVEMRNIRAGGLAVDYEPGSANDASLLTTSDVLGTKVTVTRPLNAHANASGVLTGIHPDLTEEDLRAALITCVPALTFKRLAKANQTSWVVKVTFAGPKVPKDVSLYGRKHPVKPYEVRPLQCFNCSRYGHPARTCRSTARCASCAEAHLTASCPTTVSKCANCGGPHRANDVSCPTRAFQSKVLAVKQQHGTTFRVARVAVNNATRTYAAALRGPTSTPRPHGPVVPTSVPVTRPAVQPASTQTDPAPLPPSQDETHLAKALHAVLAALTKASASAELILTVSQAFAPFLASPPSP